MPLRHALFPVLLTALGCASSAQRSFAIPTEDTETFAVFISGNRAGAMKVARSDRTITVDFEYRSNGRGPTLKEVAQIGARGMPVRWTVAGTTTFGNVVDERFGVEDDRARWVDSTGEGSASFAEPALYLPQTGTPYSVYLEVLATMSADGAVRTLPGGSARLERLESLTLQSTRGPVRATAYGLYGPALNPSYVFVDERMRLLGFALPTAAIVRDGLEGEEQRLRDAVTRYAAERFVKIQEKTARTYDGPVRIQNVRVFDPSAVALGDLQSVVVQGERIVAIEPADAEPGADEYVVDGMGGTLVAGMVETHGHVDISDALLNLAAGVTIIRDMGNKNDVLADLVAKIESGTLAGPTIVRSGFIEGKSPYNSDGGIIVSNEAEAVQAVRTYAEMGGYFQIKIYNSMKPEWVPAVIEEARKHGFRVTGHVPAFSSANEMIRAGYDEMTHINQVMLGWVLQAGEDTRTLLRLTALKRLPELDLESAPVRETMDLMVERGVAMEPTLCIHEALMLGRNGETRAGVVGYVDHMPVEFQRGAKQALAKIEGPEDDEAYRAAYGKIIETLRMMRERGILLLAGTDMGGAFELHRELEIFTELGYSNAEVLKLATYDATEYLGLAEERGSVEVGKRADFFLVDGDPVEDLGALKRISLVAKNGIFYAPSEIYPEFGIRPFTEVPKIRAPK